jgi:hypothetical protein
MQTCDAGKERACAYTTAMAGIYCDDGSGWACNEWGIRRKAEGKPVLHAFERGCNLGFEPACTNVGRNDVAVAQLARAEPNEKDLPIVLRGAKPPLVHETPADLHRIGCRQGWPGMCEETHVSGT